MNSVLNGATRSFGLILSLKVVSGDSIRQPQSKQMRGLVDISRLYEKCGLNDTTSSSTR